MRALALLSTVLACAPRSEEAPMRGALVLAEIPVHTDPGPLALFDANDDGRPDLLVGGIGVELLLGDGARGFAPAPGAPLRGPTKAADFAFGDFDGDRRVDFAVAEHDRPHLCVFLAREGGAFVPAPGSPVVVAAKPHVHTIAVCDFDGDGRLDLVTDSWPESSLVLVAGRGDGSFAGPGTHLLVPRLPIGDVRAADLDGDGHADLATPAHDADAVTILLGDGKGSFRPAAGSPFASFGGFSKLALADVDRDGDLDVVEVHRSDPSTAYKIDALSVLVNDGHGVFAHAHGSPILGLPAGSGDLAVGDVDGDGWPDVVTLGDRSATLALFRGGKSGFGNPVLARAPGKPNGLAVADLDGDGRAEILVSDAAAARVVICALIGED